MKTLISLMALCLLFTTNAQETEQSKDWKYGFNLGINRSFIDAGLPKDEIGFELGVNTQRQLSTRFFFNPSVNFAMNNALSGERSIFKSYLNIVPAFNYKLKNSESSPYLVLGPSLKYRIAKEEDEIPSNILHYSYGADLGLGWYSSLNYFDLKTEIRYSYGINNMRELMGFAPVQFHTLGLYIQFL